MTRHVHAVLLHEYGSSVGNALPVHGLPGEGIMLLHACMARSQ
jgi:hypothetical protein